MGNLIQNIPVNRPQQTTVVRPASQPVFAPNANPLLNEIQNRYPQDKIYSYSCRAYQSGKNNTCRCQRKTGLR